MDSISVNQFRENLKSWVDKIVGAHQPLKVTRRGSEDFVVIGAEDWEREQETLFVLQNSELMRQIAESMRTHGQGAGYKPTSGEADEIVGI